MKTSSRVVTAVSALALGTATAWIGPASPARAAEPAASVSEVSCVDEDGTLTVTLEAGDNDETFLVFVNGPSSADGSETSVAAGASDTVDFTGLEDGAFTVEVDREQTDADAETIVIEERTVACDVAPEGPYTNVKGTVFDSCEGYGSVSASNKPIAGAIENLQPASFEVVFVPTDDEVGGGDDPVDGGEDPVEEVEDPPSGSERVAADGETVLDSFVLDAETQTYERTFGPDELGGTGDLSLRSGEETIASAHIGNCVVVATPASGGGDQESGGPALPDTGF